MNDIAILVRIQLGVIVTFIANKVWIRPFVLENDFAAPINTFVLSYPNFCEAAVGTILLSYMGLVLKHHGFPFLVESKNATIYVIATLFAAIYVILQEFKIHNLGGRNIYDPYDVLFSVLGLIAAYLLLLFLKPRIVAENGTQ